MIQKEIKIINKLGLHARAAMKLTQLSSRYSREISMTYNNRTVHAKSIMGLMLLGASCGAILTLNVQGEDEEEAAESVEKLINDRFGEAE